MEHTPRVFLFELKPDDLFSVCFINDVGSLECPICKQQHGTFSSMSHAVHNMFEKYDLASNLPTYRTKDWKTWAAIQYIAFIPIITGDKAPIDNMNIFLLKKAHADEDEITIFARTGTANVPEPNLQSLIDRTNRLKAFW